MTMAGSEEIELKRMSTPLQDFVPSTIRFRNVVYRTSGKVREQERASSNQVTQWSTIPEKEILSNISGRFQHGRLVALMGPSGAGKSSLLNVLSGAQMFGMIGSVTINGEPVEENDPRSVYVEQECPLLVFLTVQETMQFAVDMKMPQRSLQSVKEAKINDILEMVGLNESRNTVVRSLSGGEQRRLAVAVELITNPPIMLLDEPTSGLDSVSSTQVISHLKSLAMSGRTIVCTIHQPASSLFQLFDDVYLLRQGRCLYTGPVENMLVRFARVGLRCPEYYNPADFALESISANQPEALRMLCQLVDEDMREINAGAPSSPTTLVAQLAPGKRIARYQTACYYQLYTLLKRSVLSSARDEFFLKIRLGMHLALGLVFGAVHYDAGSEAAKVLANVGCFFQLFAFVYFTNAVSVVNLNVAIKEIANNWYSREAYFFAKLIHDLPLQLFCPSFLLAIVYYLTGQPMEWMRFGMLLGVFAVGGVIGQSLGLIGGICFEVKMQNFFVANACIVPILFSGFFVNAGDMISILRPLSTVSFFRYQFHGAMQALYGYDRGTIPCGQVYCYYKKPATILEQFDIDAYGYGTSISKALVLVLIMQLIIYVGFMVRLRRINTKPVAAAPSTTLEFQDICYHVRHKDGQNKQLLNSVSGSFRSGRLAGILGPSGAGKSTLLNILSGFKTNNVTGNILINGTPIDRRKYRREVSYTPQDVCLLENITVTESLEFAADLKLSPDVTMVQKASMVVDVLKLLGLSKCANNPVANISGGEKKRLSIGLELISNPKIMFFDEPTSGLDIIAAMQVVAHLKDLAASGRCVICVIHQPSSSIIQMFDDLFVLSEGHCLYRGPLNNLVDTFKGCGFECPNYYNRADFALEIASLKHEGSLLQLRERAKQQEISAVDEKKMPNEAVNCDEKDSMLKPAVDGDSLNSSADSSTPSTDRQYPTSEWGQFVTLTRRTMLCTFRDLQLTKMRLLAHLFVGLLIAVVFYNVGNDGSKVLSNASCLFFFLIFVFFANSMPLVMTFPLETSVFVRERMNNWYSLKAYYFSKLVADFPFLILGPSVFLAGAYYLTSQPMELDRIVMLWSICIFTSWIAQMTGLLAGSVLPLELSVFCVPCSVIPMLIFCGFFVRFREMFDFLIPFTYIAYFRYSFEGAMQAIYGFDRANLPCAGDFCYFSKVPKFLESFDMLENTFVMDVCGLLGWVFVLHVALLDETVEVVIPLVKTITNLTFRNLSYSVNQQHLLRNISGTLKSGRLTAILGPSGAGKSTLLNILSGFKTQGVSGKILINNETVDCQKYRQLVAYTEQDVPLLQNLTVRETLHYVADLRLSKNVSYIHKTKIVNDIVALLGLQKCSHSQTRTLSGGERKRLSIGLELVSNPKIMFFDEPTSGLDSVASYQVISYMRDLARQGRCVATVVHQPSSELLELFDDVYVVVDGRCMYQGSLDELIPTLEEVGFSCPAYYNRADFVLKIASQRTDDMDSVEKLIARADTAINGYLENDTTSIEECANLLTSSNAPSQYPIAWWRQFVVLVRRTTLCTIRNITLTRFRLLGHLLFGLTIGSVFYNVGDDGAKVLSNVSCLILFLMFIVFANAMTVVLTFPLEMAVFVREHKSNYYPVSAYYCSKLVADFPLMLAGVSCFQLIVYYLTGQPNETERVLLFWTICVLFGWLAQMYGMVAGSVFPLDVSPFVVPASIIPAVMFSGFFIRYNELLAVFRPLTYVSYFRYGFEGLAQATYGLNRTQLGCSEMFCYYRKTSKVMEMLQMEQDRYWYDVVGLAVWIAVLHILLYVSLQHAIEGSHLRTHTKMNVDKNSIEITIPLMQGGTNLHFQNITYQVRQRKEEKQLLKNISGTFRTGRLTAILGPSGAGKSTLLNVLSGFKTQGVSGNIIVNNEIIDRQRYRQLVAYTAQDVTLLPNITLRENLHYAADLKLSREVSQAHKIKIVNDVIGLLGLQKCAHNQSQLLSGGEKKRLSIGLELVSNPKIMFFDEPTSGLDSVSSYQVISYMKDLARQGRCVISVIHQPSSELLELFDDIYVVVDGRCMYQGSLDDLIPTLAEAGFSCPAYYNRADFGELLSELFITQDIKICLYLYLKVLQIASQYDAKSGEVEKLMVKSEKSVNAAMNLGRAPKCRQAARRVHTHLNPISNCPLNLNFSRLAGIQEEYDLTEFLVEGRGPQYPISWWDQFTTLTRRTTLGTVRNPLLMGLRFFGHVLFGFTIGFVFYNIGNDASKVLSNISLLIAFLMFITFANAMTVILTYPLEMAVFVREHKSNYYSISAYYFSKLVADFPWMLSGVTAFQLIMYYLSGQLNETDRIIMFWGICALFGWLSQVYGLIAGCLFPIEISPFIVPASIIPALLFSGFFIRYNELLDFFKPLTLVSYFRYGFEGLVQATYGHNRTELGCEEIFCYYRKTSKILEALHMEPNRYWTDVLGLGIWILFLHVVLYLSLRLRLRWNR
uniref:ABC transporter domain-containing protein n=1 Tax=Anopheles stephensi TaxID=30069 RepID=A0A182YMF2_ANOST